VAEVDNRQAAEALRHMQGTEGWRLLEQYLRERIDDSRNRLMSCELEDVMKHRHEAKALEAVLIYIDQTIEEGMREDELP